MGLNAYYLGDTSAIARRSDPSVAERLNPLLEAGLVARCTPTDLEAGFSSRSPADHLRLRDERSAWPVAAMNQLVLDRAVEVQDALAARSEQRGAKIADLLIAAAAESAGLVVLHYGHARGYAAIGVPATGGCEEGGANVSRRSRRRSLRIYRSDASSVRLSVGASDEMDEDDPRVQSVMRYWQEAWSRGRVEVLSEFYAATYRENDVANTPESFAGNLLRWREIFPDFQADVDRVWTTPGAVITRVVYSGTHRGDFTFLRATGRAFRSSGLDVFEFDTEGKVVQHWHETDHWELFEQLGVEVGQS